MYGIDLEFQQFGMNAFRLGYIHHTLPDQNGIATSSDSLEFKIVTPF
jgi:hypothetical protein